MIIIIFFTIIILSFHEHNSLKASLLNLREGGINDRFYFFIY